MEINRRNFLTGRFFQGGGYLRPPGSLTEKAAISDACVSLLGVACRVCGDVCDTGAIRFQIIAKAISRPVIDAARCTGCGACLHPCPVQAVTVTAQAVEIHACL